MPSPSLPRRGFLLALALAVAALLGCRRREEPASARLRVAAAASLAPSFDALGARFEHATGTRFLASYGATGLLARQIEQGAPFDLLAVADVHMLAPLAQRGLLVPESTYVFGRGALVLWTRGDSATHVRRLEDLAQPAITRIALANPEVAPYGRAAIEALRAAGLHDRVAPKLVFAENVRQALQLAASGNADVAFVARALVAEDAGVTLPVDPALHAPIEAAVALVRGPTDAAPARAFVESLRSDAGRALLVRHGFDPP
jgi:molybdate transport system substrate-binding protein